MKYVTQNRRPRPWLRPRQDRGAAGSVGVSRFPRVEFILSVAAPSQLPPDSGAEVAFAGRSNVGKSSLVNALTGRNTLAKTSNTPGRTRELNFFALGPACYLVDMPGYGFAKAPKEKVEAWTELVFAYLQGRATLARVYLLIDARHGLKGLHGRPV